MRLTKEQQRHLETTRWLLLVAFIVSPIYTMLADGFSSWYPYMNGLIIAPSIVLIFAFFEFVVFAGRIRKKSFHFLLLVRVAAYFLAILFCILSILIITRMLKYDISIPKVIRSDEFINYLKYGDFKVLMAVVFGIVIMANFVLQMNRKMGQGVLMGFLTGRFRIPREDKTFIMFLKLKHTEDFIKSLGDNRFLEFFNEVIYDITNSFVYRRGIISSYIDDEILVIWESDIGIEDANSIRLYFEIIEKIDQHKVNYFERYGAVPSFNCTLHYGNIIIGEIGEVKSEIRYHGDAVNTTHRMLDFTSEENNFVISESALKLIQMPEIYSSELIDSVEIRGKKEPYTLYRIIEKV